MEQRKTANHLLYVSPYAFYKWLDSFFDMEAILSKYGRLRKEYLWTVGVAIFIEINPINGAFRLFPNIHMYGELGRDQYKRGHYSRFTTYLFMKWILTSLWSKHGRKILLLLGQQWIKWNIMRIKYMINYLLGKA